MAKGIMIQGTMSNAGKSILVGGLCRIFCQDGFKVAPFKSQNMALNSFITSEGLEMGRAQVMQAEAAKTEPCAAMNPILLKPTNDTGSQVIINGVSTGVMSAARYFKEKKKYIPVILEAYHELEKKYDIIVIEGAGSPAEINLKKNDIVNMGLAELVDVPVLLVGDIDRGGVFAQIVGTIMLLEEKEQERIKGVIINKFRGDKEILRPGLEMLEAKTNVPVRGVVPYFYLDIDDEDSLSERFDKKMMKGILDIAVIKFPRISNFTDFMALECIEGLTLRYVSSPGEFGNPDGVILPGSKNTIEDLFWMRQNGLEAKVLRHSQAGKMVFGICGGYQMLGKLISDPQGVEHKGAVKGMGLLPMQTVFEPEKTRTRVTGRFEQLEGIFSGFNQVEISGYEIHMGTTRFTGEGRHILKLEEQADVNSSKLDGGANNNVCGCYVHGLFDRPECAGALVSSLLTQKGMEPDSLKAVDMTTYKEEQYDKLAEVIRENIDMNAIYEILQKGN